MNILLINHYAGAPSYGMEYRPFYLAREWVRTGHAVRILGSSQSHYRARQPAFAGNVFDEEIEGIQYRWYRTPTYSGNGVGRVWNILSFLLAVSKDKTRLVNEFSPDVVIASSTYPMDIWPASKLAETAHAKLVYEVHDLWPLSPMELGGMSRHHPFIIWVQKAEDFAYRKADKVISMLPKALPHMLSRGMPANKFAYVPNGIDESDWHHPSDLPSDTARLLLNLRNTGLPLVGYAGAHGLANALDVLLDAARLLKGKVNFVLVGNGPERERLLNRVSKEGIENVAMLPSIPKNSIPKFLERLDVAYIGLKPSPLFRFGISPNKLMDYMMAGKPVVLAVDAGDDPVAKAGCGFTVEPGNCEAVADAIVKLVEMPKEQRESMGRAGQQFILRNQTYAVLAETFLQSIGQDIVQ